VSETFRRHDHVETHQNSWSFINNARDERGVATTPEIIYHQFLADPVLSRSAYDEWGVPVLSQPPAAFCSFPCELLHKIGLFIAEVTRPIRNPPIGRTLEMIPGDC